MARVHRQVGTDGDFSTSSPRKIICHGAGGRNQEAGTRNQEPGIREQEAGRGSRQQAAGSSNQQSAISNRQSAIGKQLATTTGQIDDRRKFANRPGQSSKKFRLLNVRSSKSRAIPAGIFSAPLGGMTIKSYRDLLVWQNAMHLVEGVYAVAKAMPANEVYGLTRELKRSAVSIPSNIAEGRGEERPVTSPTT